MILGLSIFQFSSARLFSLGQALPKFKFFKNLPPQSARPKNYGIRNPGSDIVRLSEFVRTQMFSQIRTTRTWIEKPGPDPVFNPDMSECPNVKYGHKNGVHTRFFRVGQIRVIGSDSFLPALRRTHAISKGRVTQRLQQ